jgi:hypothetical protein
VAAEMKPASPAPVAAEMKPASPAPVAAEMKPASPAAVAAEMKPASPAPVAAEMKPASPAPVAAEMKPAASGPSAASVDGMPAAPATPAASMKSAGDTKPAAMAPQAADGKPQAADPTKDYYTEHAKEQLEQEVKSSGLLRVHPLQAAEPSNNVVVCEAGCGPKGQHVVSRKPKVEIKAPPAPQVDAGCRAGCYRWVASVPDGLEPTEPVLDAAKDDSRWMTTEDEAAPTKVPEISMRRKSAKTAREDWLARINRERSAEKTAQ